MVLDCVATRKDLAKYFAELGYELGAEIGVLSGSYAAELCKQNPSLHLICVDMWDLNPSRYKGFRERKYEQAVQTLEPYNCHLLKGFSLDMVQYFTNESLDFVYIDANHHFDHVMQDIIQWGRRVRKGGIIAGDDYSAPDVKLAADAYATAHGWKLYVTTADDRHPSWYIYKGRA